MANDPTSLLPPLSTTPVRIIEAVPLAVDVRALNLRAARLKPLAACQGRLYETVIEHLGDTGMAHMLLRSLQPLASMIDGQRSWQLRHARTFGLTEKQRLQFLLRRTIAGTTRKPRKVQIVQLQELREDSVAPLLRVPFAPLEKTARGNRVPFALCRVEQLRRYGTFLEVVSGRLDAFLLLYVGKDTLFRLENDVEAVFGTHLRGRLPGLRPGVALHDRIDETLSANALSLCTYAIALGIALQAKPHPDPVQKRLALLLQMIRELTSVVPLGPSSQNETYWLYLAA